MAVVAQPKAAWPEHLAGGRQGKRLDLVATHDEQAQADEVGVVSGLPPTRCLVRAHHHKECRQALSP